MTNLKELADKGNGLLVKTGTVWTYPGAEFDPSGTNLRLPLEYATDVEVQEALGAGQFVAAVSNPSGVVTSIRLAGGTVIAVAAGLTGTAEMGTELPVGSRPESDAGTATITQAEVERSVTDSLQGKPAEGAEIKGRQAAEDPRRRDGDKGPFSKEPTQDIAGARRGR